MKKRGYRAVAIGLSALFVLIVLSASYEKRRSRDALKKHRQHLADTGESLSVTNHIPEVSDEEEALARALVALSTNLHGVDQNVPAMAPVKPGVARLVSADARIRSKYLPDWGARLEERLASLPDVRTNFENLIHGKSFRHRLNYEPAVRDLEETLAYLAALRNLSKYFAAATIFDLNRKRTDEAHADLLCAIELVRAYKAEPLLACHLARLGMGTLAMHSTWEFLYNSTPSDEQLASIQKAWQSVDFWPGAARTFQMERARSAGIYAETRKSGQFFEAENSPAQATNGPEDRSDALLGRISHRIWRTWSYDDELFTMKNWEAALRSLREMQKQESFGVEGGVEGGRHPLIPAPTQPPVYYVLAWLSPNLDRLVERLGHFAAMRNLAITATGLKRFQLRSHDLPQSLQELVPGFLHRVPLDPIDGLPVKYRRLDRENFILYSIGADEIDDGGDATKPSDPNRSSMGRDWVWPRLANPEELPPERPILNPPMNPKAPVRAEKAP